MVKYHCYAVSMLLTGLASNLEVTNAYVNPSARATSRSRVSSTELYIIGPMIRKMREENAQKQMPMAQDEDREGEAPGVRVGGSAWKWPPVWPYDRDAFTPKEDIKKPPQGSPMGSLLGQMPVVPEIDENEEEESKFDVMKYWQEEKATQTTDIDEPAAKKLSE